MKVDRVKILFFCLFAILIVSCTDEDNPQDISGGPGVHLNMTRASQDIINNIQVYMFDGDGGDAGQFKTKVPGLVYRTDGVSMKVESGKWDFALVTAEDNIESNIISPVRGNLRNTAMWVTQPTGSELKSMPELRFGYLVGQTVNANQNATAGPLDLYRNVAMVRVYIEEANGLDINGTSTMELKGVPTTLSWEGKLMPDKVTPTISTSPMKGKFTVKNHPNKTGYQQSEAIEFIIPAHRGSDFLSTNPKDTTEQHLTLSVDLALLGGGRNTKNNIFISKVPRMNGILEVRLFAGGEVKVTADILNWEDKNINTGISNTVLETDKASVGLAYKDTVYVNTNADTFTVEGESVPWLTVQRIGTTNAIEITANVDTYVDNSPRDSYFTIKANNLTKKIPVQQRPDRGTISVDQEKLFLSVPHPTKSLNVTSIGGDWQIIGSTLKAKPNINSGLKGSTTAVSFTRETVGDEDYYSRVYGDTIVVFKNKMTLDTDTVRISNLFIGIEDNEIMVAQPTQTNDTTCIVNNVAVFGGDYSGLNIYSRPYWIWPAPSTYYDPNTKKFYFRCDREDNGEPRWDDITLQHTDDPDYRVTVRIVQDIIVDIPEFDFYSVTFTWSNGNDVDIRCGFTGNTGTYTFSNGVSSTVTVPFDNKYVGFSQGNTTVNYNSKLLIQWGGDELDGDKGETFFFNAPVMNLSPYPEQYGVTPSTSNVLPRKLKITINAGWFTSSRKGDPITCTVGAYRGGDYYKDGHAYFFTGDTVYFEKKTYPVWEKATSAYYKFCTIEYDRKKHTAKVEWNTVPSVQTRSLTNEKEEEKKKKEE